MIVSIDQARHVRDTYECLREVLDTYPDKPILVGRGDCPDA